MPPFAPPDFQMLFERSPARSLVLLPDAQFTVVAVSDGYLRAMGRQREELVGRKLFEAFPDQPEGENGAYARNLSASLTRALVTRMPDAMPPPQGSWAAVNAPLLGDDGQVRYLLHLVEDAPRAAAAPLAESLERVRILVEASGTGTWELDVASGRFAGDARCLALLGLARGSALTLETSLANVHPDDRERMSRAVAAALAGEAGGAFTIEFRTGAPAAGKERWVEMRGQAQRDAAGCPVRLIGTVVEVTARKWAEGDRERLLAEAEAAKAQLEAIFQSIPDALYVGGPDGMERANAPALAQLGYDTLEDLNRNVASLAAEIQTRRVDTGAFIPAEDQAFSRALRGTPDVQDVRVRDRKTGEERIVRSSCAPIRAGDKVVGAVAINTDITERMNAELALRERAEFEKQLIGIVSHDLRNPLQVIHLGVTTLRRREDLDERAIRTLLRIEGSTDRAIRLVKDLLDFTQARLTGRLSTRPEPVDLHPIVRQAVDEVQMTYADRTVQVRQEGDGRGIWDPDRLTQVVTNLVTNAVKYSPASTPVTVVSRAEGEEVVLEVHNLGAPISEVQLGSLFQPLQRGSSEGDPTGRSVGLGLYIVQEVVKAHRGSIGVRSNAEDGTTFTVRLPRT